MALFFSAFDDDPGDDRPHFSLLKNRHIKTHRIWMFALMKDHPGAVERDHINRCDACGKAFRSALGISGFSATKYASGTEETVNDERTRAA